MGNHSENSETQKRRMKDSNLQVVSDWPASNRLHYHSVNTAECFSIYRHISRSVCIYSRKEFSNATLGELVEWDTNSRTRRNWFTVSLLCPLAYPPISKMRFCWTVISHKTGSVIFHVYTHYCAHVRLQLITASSLKDTELSFTILRRVGIEPPSLNYHERIYHYATSPITATRRLATIFIVPCVALDFRVFTD